MLLAWLAQPVIDECVCWVGLISKAAMLFRQFPRQACLICLHPQAHLLLAVRKSHHCLIRLLPKTQPPRIMWTALHRVYRLSNQVLSQLLATLFCPVWQLKAVVIGVQALQQQIEFWLKTKLHPQTTASMLQRQALGHAPRMQTLGRS